MRPAVAPRFTPAAGLDLGVMRKNNLPGGGVIILRGVLYSFVRQQRVFDYYRYNLSLTYKMCIFVKHLR